MSHPLFFNICFATRPTAAIKHVFQGPDCLMNSAPGLEGRGRGGSFCLSSHVLHVSLYHRLLGGSINTLLIRRLIALVFTAQRLICSNGPESKCSHHQPAVTDSTPLTFSRQTHFIHSYDCNFFLLLLLILLKATICSFDSPPPP